MSDERAAAMRESGMFYCPTWCVQPDDEHETERHLSAAVGHNAVDGQEVLVRVARGWWEEGPEDLVLVQTTLDEDGELVLSFADWASIASTVEYLISQSDGDDVQWAYDGADEDRDDDGE